MLNTVHLLTFLTVAELGTYSAAAERLHLTQPAVSQQIRQLEQQLGDLRLFRRVAQRMILTHAGEELLPAARDIIQLAERTETTMLALRGHVHGHVRLACPAGTGETILPTLLALFRQRWPNVHLTLEVAPTDQILNWLNEQRIHIGWIDESVRRRGWECLLIAREPLIFCAPADHPWHHEAPITLGMLRDIPLIVPRPGTAFRRVIDDGLKRAGINLTELRIGMECDSPAAIWEAIRAGLGLGWIPVSCHPNTPSARTLHLSGLNLATEWYIVGSKDSAFGRAIHDCRAFFSSRETHPLLRNSGLEP